MSETLHFRPCLCGQCQPQWLLNAWVCPEIWRNLEPRSNRSNLNFDFGDPWSAGGDPWNDPWSEDPPRQEDAWSRWIPEPWHAEDDNPWVAWQPRDTWEDRRDPWWDRGSDPWAADITPAPRRHFWRRHIRTRDAWEERGANREFNAFTNDFSRLWDMPRQRSVSPTRWPEPEREDDWGPWRNAGTGRDHGGFPQWIADNMPWDGGEPPAPRGPLWLEDPLLANDPWVGDLLGEPGGLDFLNAFPGFAAGRRLFPWRGLGLAEDSESESDDPDLARALEESLRTAEAEEERRAAADRERQAALRGRCVICFEEKQGGASCSAPATSSTGSSRAGQHFLCHDCVAMYVENELKQDDTSDRRLMERRAFGHCLRCPCSPMPLDCGGFMEERHVRPFLDAPLWSQLQTACEEDPEFLREALLRSMPNAVQCGSCQYGPIDHAGCEDLDAHHWQWQGNSQIQNQCPKCGWWAHSIDSWPAWDGVIRQ